MDDKKTKKEMLPFTLECTVYSQCIHYRIDKKNKTNRKKRKEKERLEERERGNEREGLTQIDDRKNIKLGQSFKFGRQNT